MTTDGFAEALHRPAGEVEDAGLARRRSSAVFAEQAQAMIACEQE